MPEEVPALSGRTRIVVGVGVGLVIAAGLILRFWTRSGLWLDEALTVDIARLPLHEIPNALKHDGAPPLYYYLLHFWIVLFGQSNVAVRSLSGVIAVVTLPVGVAVRQAIRGPRRGVDDARAPGERAVRRLLRHRVAHVRARHPAHRLRVPGPATDGDRAASGQPGGGRRRHGGAPLHPVLVPLPRRHGRHLARGVHRAAAAVTGTPRRRPGPRSSPWPPGACSSCRGCRRSSIRPSTRGPRGRHRRTSRP